MDLQRTVTAQLCSCLKKPVHSSMHNVAQWKTSKTVEPHTKQTRSSDTRNLPACTKVHNPKPRRSEAKSPGQPAIPMKPNQIRESGFQLK